MYRARSAFVFGTVDRPGNPDFHARLQWLYLRDLRVVRANYTSQEFAHFVRLVEEYVVPDGRTRILARIIGTSPRNALQSLTAAKSMLQRWMRR